MTLPFIIKPFNWRDADAKTYAALHRFHEARRAERWPEDPPLPLDDAISEWRTAPPYHEIEAFAAWNDDESAMVGVGRVIFRHAADNQHVVEFEIGVLPEWRRQGIGHALLARVSEMPRRDQRRLMLGWTLGRVPAGVAFMERIGATCGLVEKVSQLELADLNRNLVDEWIRRAPERAAGFDLGFIDGPYSESEITEIVELLAVMNTAPRQSLDLEDEQLTVEQVRSWEKGWTERGIVRWTVYARERATGKLAGFSDLFYNPHQPMLLRQSGTGVWPHYRNKGIGRWLKAAMIERVLRERPEARAIRTDNASDNAAMLGINIQLGFKPLMENRAWQVDTGKVVGYLEGRGMTG